MPTTARKKATPALGPASRRGRPAKITRKDIVSALLHNKGEVTFRAIADHLNVSTQALYRHVGSVAEIIDMVAQELASEYPFPPDDGRDWFDWAYECGQILKRFYEKIPNLAQHAVEAPEELDVILSRYEVSIVIAKRSGLDALSAYWATGLVFEFVRGWVEREQRHMAKRKFKSKDTRSIVKTIKEKRSKELPLLVEALKSAESRSPEERFDFMLRQILAGIASEQGLEFRLAEGGAGRRAAKS